MSDYYDIGYARAMRAAGLEKTATGYQINIEPDDAFHLGAAAKSEDKSYLGTALVPGLGASAAAGAIGGGKYRALTGQSMLGTLNDVRKNGVGQALENIQQGHLDTMGDAFHLARKEKGLMKALKHIDGGAYAKRGLKGALLGGALGLGANTVSNLAQYGVGHAISDDPSVWDKIKGVVS